MGLEPHTRVPTQRGDASEAHREDRGSCGWGCPEVSMSMPGTDDSHRELRGSREKFQREPSPADIFISDFENQKTVSVIFELPSWWSLTVKALGI